MAPKANCWRRASAGERLHSRWCGQQVGGGVIIRGYSRVLCSNMLSERTGQDARTRMSYFALKPQTFQPSLLSRNIWIVLTFWPTIAKLPEMVALLSVIDDSFRL